MHLSRLFSTVQNRFWTFQILMLFSVFAVFVSPLPPWQTISLWGLFSSREIKKSHLGQDQVNKEGRVWGLCHFLSKTAEHSAWCGQVLVNLPSQNGQTHWKNLQKKFSEAQCSFSQQCQLVHWYSWVPRTLSKWGKPVLQGACPPEDNSIFCSPLPCVTLMVVFCYMASGRLSECASLHEPFKSRVFSGWWWKRKSGRFRARWFSTPFLALKMEGAAYQGMQVASRSWEWPLADSQQIIRTSVLQMQGMGSANTLNEGGSRLFPRASIQMPTQLTPDLVLWDPEQRGRRHALPDSDLRNAELVSGYCLKSLRL